MGAQQRAGAGDRRDGPDQDHGHDEQPAPGMRRPVLPPPPRPPPPAGPRGRWRSRLRRASAAHPPGARPGRSGCSGRRWPPSLHARRSTHDVTWTGCPRTPCDARRLAAHPQRRAVERPAGGPARRVPPGAVRRRGAGQPARRPRVGRPRARRAGRRDAAGAGRGPAGADRRRGPRRDRRGPARRPRRRPEAGLERLTTRALLWGDDVLRAPTRCAAPSAIPPGWAAG